VAGGDPSDQVVEVLMEGQWWSLLSLPHSFYPKPTTIHSGNLHIGDVYCDLQALQASRQAPNNTVRLDPDGLWNYEFNWCEVGYVSFQGQLLCSIDKELRVNYDDSLVAIGKAVGHNYRLIGGKLINMRGNYTYTASIKGTIVATVVNAESLAVFPPTFSVFISS
jgi:hypothetical protein